MAILLCAATTFEIEPTVQLLKSGALKTNDMVEVLITGVGLVAATYHLTRQLLLKKPPIVIQAGVGGCLDEHIALGETVVIKNEFIGDLGVQEHTNFQTLFHLNLLKDNEQPFKERKLGNPYNNLMEACNLKVTDGVTVNEISTNRERINFYKNYYKASIESLEGAALHYVALMEDIPFLQLRAVSNYIGERDKKNWLMKGAIDNLNTTLQRILIKL